MCYSVLFIFSRIFLVWPQQYTFLVLMSDIYYTGTLVGLETLWFLPSMFIAELLFNMIYGSRRKMGIAVCLAGAASVSHPLYQWFQTGIPLCGASYICRLWCISRACGLPVGSGGDICL